jgi:multiple sugar transport system permease protein
MRRSRRVASHLVLLFGALLVAFPFFWMLSTSLKTGPEADRSPPTLLPASPQIANYVDAWQSAAKTTAGEVTFTTYFLNSLFVAACVTGGVLFTSILAAYGFARMQFPAKHAIFLLFLATMMIPFEVVLVPNFRTMVHLRWYDTYAALAVPWMANVFSIFILRQFFLAIPQDYFEAAQLDGCGHWRTVWQVAVPMAAPAVVTITIFTFLGSWNALMWPMLVTDSADMRVVQVGLSILQGEESTQFQILMAGSAIVILPVIVLYLFLQRRFIEGVSSTGIKG